MAGVSMSSYTHPPIFEYHLKLNKTEIVYYKYEFCFHLETLNVRRASHRCEHQPPTLHTKFQQQQQQQKEYYRVEHSLGQNIFDSSWAVQKCCALHIHIKIYTRFTSSEILYFYMYTLYLEESPSSSNPSFP